MQDVHAPPSDHELPDMSSDESMIDSDSELIKDLNPSLNSTIETNHDSDQADDEPQPEPEFDFEVGSQVCDDDLQLDPDPVVSNIKHFDASQYEHGVAIAPLYEGASVTVLEAVAQHLLWFTDHPGTSKQAYYMQHHSILPKGNLLPDSYYEAIKIVDDFLIEPLVF